MRLALLPLLVSLVGASTLKPPVVPLIVRNPYLSTWLTGARAEPWEKWPMFWTGESIGFGVMVSVPETNTVYPLLGRQHDSLQNIQDITVSYPEYLGPTFDASTTNLTYCIPNAAHNTSATVVLSFLSPITPASTLRQSLPAAYLTVFVEGSFDFNLYLDLNGQWVSGSSANNIRWELVDGSLVRDSPKGPALKTWRISRLEEELYTEYNDRGEWGMLHFSAPAGLNHESGTSTTLREQFARHGHILNETDSQFRGIMEAEPVFAFSKSFQLASNSSRNAHDSVLFSIALTQDPIVQFAAARGLTHMRPFWANFFQSADEMVRYHYGDFDTARDLAKNYSQQLSEDAYASGAKEYEEIAALSARQVLGATEFSGTVENPLLFLKEISSNGNCQTVDVIFPAFPFFLYTNPRWLAYLLEPLLEHQLSGQYPNDYSMHDLGSHFPNQTGHADGRDEYMPVEECGNMLIMGLALVNAFRYETQPAFTASVSREGTQRLSLLRPQQQHYVDEYGIDRSWAGMGTTGSKEAARWAGRSYRLWKQWTGYLVKYSLVPENQLCTDDFAGWLRYQTNLALKGIIGIRAMAEISRLVGEDADARHYLNVAETYIEKWQEYGISRDGTHAKLAYDWFGSWTTLYNLYADSLLCLHLPDDQEVEKEEEEEREQQTMGLGGYTPWRSEGDEGERQQQQQQQQPLHGHSLPVSPSSPSSGEKKKAPFVPDKIYKMQSDWYHYVRQKYGLPLDSRHLYTKSDWEFFAAAISSNRTRKELLDSVSKWVDETITDKPFTDLYDTEGEGGYPGMEFKARPVVGGHFAFLALERACGGRAVEALRFLDELPVARLDVDASLADDLGLSGSWPELRE